LKKYSQIDYLNYVGGKLVFIGKKLYSEDPSTPSYLVYGGEEIAKDYSTIQSVAFVQGKSIVIATQDKGNVSKFVVFIDGVIKDLGYGAIYKVLEIGGKAAYSVKKGEKKFIVYDGKELGKEYDSAELPFVFNSKLAFFAKQGEKSFIVIEN
jgi:hypothetical protein